MTTPAGGALTASAPGRARQLWHRPGENVFAVLSVVVVVVEAGALGGLVWALLFSPSLGSSGMSALQDALVGAVIATASLIGITTATMAYLVRTGARRVRAAQTEGAAWASTWRNVLDGVQPCPAGPLDRAASVSLLSLTETLSGAALHQATAAIRATGTDLLLLQRLHAATGAPGYAAHPVRAWRARRTGTILDILDDLVRARLPEALTPLLGLAGDRRTPVRLHAVRAAARTIARIEDDRERSARCLELLERLIGGGFPRGVLDETLVLLEDGAEPLIRAVLDARSSRPKIIAAALDGVGRLRLTGLGPLVPAYLDVDQSLDVRAAAFRALASLPSLPPGADGALRQGLRDPFDPVRAQASRAARLLPVPEAVGLLGALLADRSWWVRRAAGETLAATGPAGRTALADAARTQPDRFARQMAAQVLADQAPSEQPAEVERATA